MTPKGKTYGAVVTAPVAVTAVVPVMIASVAVTTGVIDNGVVAVMLSKAVMKLVVVIGEPASGVGGGVRYSERPRLIMLSTLKDATST